MLKLTTKRQEYRMRWSKLERFFSGKHFQPSLIFVSMDKAYPSEGKDHKYNSRINALAYFSGLSERSSFVSSAVQKWDRNLKNQLSPFLQILVFFIELVPRDWYWRGITLLPEKTVFGTNDSKPPPPAALHHFIVVDLAKKAKGDWEFASFQLKIFFHRQKVRK